MFSKHISQLIYEDIEDLVKNRQEKEGHHLDYKVSIGNVDKAKKELAKDVSSFANTSGGYLVIGVSNNFEIVGIDAKIQNKDVDEWLNQVLSSNIEPSVFYHDPKVINIPGTGKVIVVIHIPESNGKPHIVTESNCYYVRVNDSSKLATHYQIRDMFEFSRNRRNEWKDFLRSRNLDDEKRSDFGRNNNSNALSSRVEEVAGLAKPFVLFNLIPKHLDKEMIKMPIVELRDWLQRHSSGYGPCTSMSLYSTGYNDDIKLDGIVLKQIGNNGMSSYFEILNNGFVEAGFSDSFTYISPQATDASNVAVFLTDIVAYEMILLGFARDFYSHIKYYDEVLLQISFVNVLNFKLYNFNDAIRLSPFYEQDDIRNKHHNNFRLNYSFSTNGLTEGEILEVAKEHSERICRAFGLEKDMCFVDNQLSLSSLWRFRL